MDLFLRIIDITFPIFSITALGFACGKHYRPDMRSANQLLMDIFIPALIFSVMIGQSVDVRQFLPLICAASLIVLGSGLIIWPIATLAKVESKTLLPPVMFNNSGNMGLPLLALTFGDDILPLAMILFLTENLLHFTVGTGWLNKNKKNTLSVLVSPINIATLLGIVLGANPIEINKTLMAPIDMLGQIAIPLMLFGLGVRLSTSNLKALSVGILGGIAAPVSGLLIVLMITPLFNFSTIEQGALFLFAVLPPAVLNYMFAERYHQEPDKVASIVIIGNGLTLITLPLALGYVLPRFV